ncbi:putative mediator of RNA polymerase II transcription subunit 26 isoform X2 [Phymastichus coffea]|nr:putative mediator of RNA polymerase II transcription subunit 26 isoform X2 [Phymastichus coffea]XP_058799703.1 putative mediator of RNA polymerase II transcription subunit 26 isoform X2 [Phymastichus coffea]XP_058799704.1 putative mediator of RNA polymerase II transcription subunit 26 isoform X2 [Phymastichus coffea]XP_058799705.1 putative mediator of RNA polymerase II transcription subunit 26 isoform X2 [Phymastichus coffea]
MSEGAPPRTKRNGARSFKNPPQPHMCIKDYIMGSSIPCYINVLSWEKVDMPTSPNEPLPLYGGMPLTPPRTEDKNTKVFAVIVHPEVLKQRGKNAQDQNEQSSLVDVLLDFLESTNKGIVFKRIYTILKDRDITGELKEVWISVQNQREREVNQQETWIDGQPPIPQYTQPVDQQQQQQQHQQVQEQYKQQFQHQQQQFQHQQQQFQQQLLHRQQQLQQQPQIQLQPQQLPQQIPQQVQVSTVPQQQIQQNQQMLQNSYMMSQPPQYQHNIVSNLSSNDCSNYDKYGYPQQNPVPVSQNEQAYQQNPMLVRTYNNGNGSRIDSDRFNYRERGRSLPQQPMPKQLPPPQQPQQQNCPAYPASQYHFQQLPRQMMPQYVNSNMPPSYGGQMNPIPANPYSDFNMIQHKHMLPTDFKRRHLKLESQMQAEIHRMQQQEQQMLGPPPPHIQQSASQYQSTGINVVDPPLVKFVRMYKGNSYGRNNMSTSNRNNAPPLKKNMENTTKPKSPVKVLQRDQLLQNKHNISQSSPEKNLKSLEKTFDGINELDNVQVTDLDEEDPKPKEIAEVTNEVSPKKPEALNYAAALKEFKDLTDRTVESKSSPVENPMPSSSESHIQETKEVKQQYHNQKRRSIKTVLNRNKAGTNDGKVWAKDANKSMKNGMKTSFEFVTNLNPVERLQDKDVDEQSKGSQPDVQASTGWNGHVKQKASDSPKRTQSTVNSIIKIFKIHQGNNGTGEEVTTNKKFKSNGQIKTNSKMTVNEQEDTNQGYTILKKSVATVNTSDEVVTEIAQLSIQDCKDTVEKNAVLS